VPLCAARQPHGEGGALPHLAVDGKLWVTAWDCDADSTTEKQQPKQQQKKQQLTDLNYWICWNCIAALAWLLSPVADSFLSRRM
jgi:hypothetical protein